MRRSKAEHGGFTLIELILVVAATSIILGLCGGVLHALLRVHRSSQEHLAEASTVGRLALQFRQDAWSATGARAIGEAGKTVSGLELTMPGGRTVNYRADRSGLLRTQFRPGEVGRRDLFLLPRLGLPRFEVSDDRGTTLAALILARRAGGDEVGGRIREWRIEGSVGGDDRLRKGGRENR